MRVLALSLVTNQAVLDPAPRNRDFGSQVFHEADLSRMNAEGKANHDEVLDASHKASSSFQVSIFATASHQEVII